MDDVEKRVIGKVMRRLIPFLILCYFVAYLDRVNVGFAKLHMNQALGLSEAAATARQLVHLDGTVPFTRQPALPHPFNERFLIKTNLTRAKPNYRNYS